LKIIFKIIRVSRDLTDGFPAAQNPGSLHFASPSLADGEVAVEMTFDS